MSQSSRPSRQGLWQPRFSIRHDSVITAAELNSLRQRLQCIDRLMNNIAGTLQKVRLRPSPQINQYAADAVRLDVITEKLQLARNQLASRLHGFSERHASILDTNVLSEVKCLVENLDTALAECCSELTQH